VAIQSLMITLQYVSKRFSWSVAEVQSYSSILYYLSLLT
jgi:hypothetical protein